MAAQDMSNALSGLVPGQDPADVLTQMRKQRIADFLTQSAMTPLDVQQPQASVGGKYVQARINPLAGLAKIAEAVMAPQSDGQLEPTRGEELRGRSQRLQ